MDVFREVKMAHEKYLSCIETCHDCMAACDYCAQACLGEPDAAQLAHCVKLDMDCAALCNLAAGAMSRNSQFIDAICALCADVCTACAEECEQHPHEHCRTCAVACRRCASECRRMAPLHSSGTYESRMRGTH